MIWLKKAFLSIFTCITLSCSVEVGNTPPQSGASSERVFYFKATGGEHSYIAPIIGIRIYDNNVYSGTFRRDCDQAKDSAIEKAALSSSGKPLSEEKDVGGFGRWASDCSYNVNLIFDGNTLSVVGSYNHVEKAFDIEMAKASKEEFFQILKANTAGKGKKYQDLPRDDRDEFDEICKYLTDATCDQSLK